MTSIRHRLRSWLTRHRPPAATSPPAATTELEATAGLRYIATVRAHGPSPAATADLDRIEHEILELFPDAGLRTIGPTRQGEDARRTERSLIALAGGYHPVSKIRLHDDAPPVEDRQAPGPRCGNCGHLERKPGARRVYLKCEDHRSSGPGTDLRAWWPACAAWIPPKAAPKDGGS